MTTHLMAGSGTWSLALCGSTVLPGDKVQSNLEEATCPYCVEIAKMRTTKADAEWSDAENRMCLQDVKSKQIGGSHYADQKIQPWDVMQSMSNRDSEDMFAPFQWHLIFTALKYLMRCGRKGPAEEDIDKAIHYLEKLRESLTT